MNTNDLVARLTAITDFVTPFAVQAACELGIPDAIGDVPVPVEELAERVCCQPEPLRRLLRTLSRKEIFVEVEPGSFGLGTLGHLLRTEHPASLHAANLPWLPRIQALNSLAYSIRTGKSAFEHVHGVTVWEYLATHPEDSALFDRQMRSISGFEATSLLRSYDWPSAGTVVDVGGGDGLLLDAVLREHTGLKGVLVDLPQVVGNAVGPFDTVAGDFFEMDLPGTGDLYVLKRIVYGFADDQVLRLLANVRAAARTGAKVLVVEPFSSDTADEPYFTHRVDLQMLACPGGRVRSERRLGELLETSGFTVTRTVASATPAIEACAR
ncbi:methyltransferase [Streptomyces sp. NPDC054770]